MNSIWVLEIFLVVTVMIAAVVQSSTGFGFALIIMSLWPMFLNVCDAMLLQQFAAGVLIFSLAVKYRKYIVFKNIWLPLILALGGTTVGMLYMTKIDNRIALKYLGGALIAISIYFLFFGKRIRIPNNKLTGAIAGTSTGLLSGFFNIAGPPVVLYYSSVLTEKHQYMATLQFFFSVIIFYKMIFLSFTLEYTKIVVMNIPVVVTASIAGVIIGSKLFEKIPSELTRKTVYIMMIITGIFYLIK